jgi:hypothetical protein
VISTADLAQRDHVRRAALTRQQRHLAENVSFAETRDFASWI